MPILPGNLNLKDSCLSSIGMTDYQTRGRSYRFEDSSQTSSQSTSVPGGRMTSDTRHSASQTSHPGAKRAERAKSAGCTAPGTGGTALETTELHRRAKENRPRTSPGQATLHHNFRTTLPCSSVATHCNPLPVGTGVSSKFHWQQAQRKPNMH
jgi:hypothetical protein